MTGGLIPGSIFLCEYANYTKITYSRETGKKAFHTYHLVNFKDLECFDLCLN